MSGMLHLERIESSVGTGFPDVSVAGGGKQFLIETKVAKPVGSADFLYFERFQLPFYQKRLKYTDGKGIFIVALCDDCFVVWKAIDVLNAPREKYRKWSRVEGNKIKNPLFCLPKPWPKQSLELAAGLMIKES